MLYFGIPLISRKAAVNWDHTVRLLNNTLASVAQQTDSRVRCLIACHDIPPIDESFRHFVTFLPVDMPIPSTVMEMRADKGRKKMEIGVHLRTLGGGYLMFLDSDDLVHRDFAAHVLNTNASGGYIVKNGYEFYSENRRLLSRRDFNQVCGSCAIFNLKVADLPTSAEDENCFYSKLKSHKEFESICREAGRPLTPITFPAVVYLRTSDITISTRFFKATGLRLWKKRVKQLLWKKRLTPDICRAFALQA